MAGDVCDLHWTCALRRAAVASGAFFPNFVHGWIWRDAKRPNKPWRVCPWCGRPLATMAEIAERVLYGAFESGGDEDE